MKFKIEIDGNMDDIKNGLLNELKTLRVFPLQTLQAMADRWGVSKQTVNNWAMRHDNFPKPVNGVEIMEETKSTPRLYPLYGVERYERERKLTNGK